MRRGRSLTRLRTYLVGTVTIVLTVSLAYLFVHSILTIFKGATLPGDDEAPIIELLYEKRLDLKTLKSGQIIEDGFFDNFFKHNIPDYQLPSNIPQEYLVSFGIWEVVNSELFREKIRFDDNGYLLVAAEDVEAAIRRHFEFNENIIHKSVEVHGNFEYNVTTKTYIVPIFGVNEALIGRIVSQTVLDDGRLSVVVDYIDSGAQDEYVIFKNEEKHPPAVRTAKIVLSGRPGEYKFDSLVTTYIAAQNPAGEDSDGASGQTGESSEAEVSQE